LLGALAGCASPPVAPLNPQALQALLAEESAEPPLVPAAADDMMALSPAMRHHLEVTLAPAIRRLGPLRALHQALFQPGALQLDYDASVTRNAAQAFEARSGNCMSLVLMSAALARHLGLEVEFRWVHGASQWQRDPELLLHSGHVSLVLAPRLGSRRSGYDATAGLEVDFMPPPPSSLERHSSRLTEPQLRALFLNNRAAEHLRDGALNEAYRWARAAVLSAPDQAAGLNTLAVIHQRRGHASAAEAVWRHLLAADPKHTSSLANLAALLQNQGRLAEAQMLRQRLAAAEASPPFFALNQGIAAHQRGDHQQALRWLTREADTNGSPPELLFWLARVHFALGNHPAAQLAMAHAVAGAQTLPERQRYSAKLAWLQARHHVPEPVQ
jgi:Tfp pilus assembly protein PilF